LFAIDEGTKSPFPVTRVIPAQIAARIRTGGETRPGPKSGSRTPGRLIIRRPGHHASVVLHDLGDSDNSR
jgi:hypothetical protein